MYVLFIQTQDRAKSVADASLALLFIAVKYKARPKTQVLLTIVQNLLLFEHQQKTAR